MLEKIRETLSEQFEVEKETIDLSTAFSDLGADSIDLFELVMNIEEEYSVEIPTDDLKNIKTVGDFVNYLKSRGIGE